MDAAQLVADVKGEGLRAGLKTELVARILLTWPRTKLRRWWSAGDLLVPIRDNWLDYSLETSPLESPSFPIEAPPD